ncbi:serpin B5-like [Adelges cooleyi]|uniref:serpin B5-like n=1 Tax=Adelges cooleyi TaxID=133065 RepID=UPI00218055E0|nr:serpin B5-like [Adelges cooleyi]
MFFRIPLAGLCLVAIVSTLDVNGEQISKTTQFLANAALQATIEDRYNYVSSPLAASIILGLVTEGAEGDTKSELLAASGSNELLDKEAYKKVLTSIKGLSSDGTLQNKVVLKNFVYVYKNYSVHESFAELAKEYYLADVKSVARPDLEVRILQTREDVTNTAFNEHAMLMFNGFSLEMSWPTSTWHRTSVSWDGNVIRAFGAAGNFALGYVPSVDCTAFKLPYKNTDYSLLVLVPKTKSTLDDTLKSLPENSIDEITKTLTMKPAFVTMPCFESSNITSFKSVLKEKTKVNRVFTETADLSNISSDKLYLDDMVQQAGIEVCIDGTSAFSLSSSAFAPQRVIKEYIVVDKPFVYILYNESNNVILVAGKVEQPNWQETENNSNTDIETIKM